jgi:hypothetical protein
MRCRAHSSRSFTDSEAWAGLANALADVDGSATCKGSADGLTTGVGTPDLAEPGELVSFISDGPRAPYNFRRRA